MATTLALRNALTSVHDAAALQSARHTAPITLTLMWCKRTARVGLFACASLLTALSLASRLLFAAVTPPINLTANLAYYASGGYAIEFCATGWEMGHAGSSTPTCSTVSTPQWLLGSNARLDAGDYLSVVLEGEALHFDALLARWGIPRLLRKAQDQLELVWDLPTIQATASLTWGEPHSIPSRAILTLKPV